MAIKAFWLAALATLLCGSAFRWQAPSGTLTVVVNNLASQDGQVYLALYNRSDSFMNIDKAVAGKSVRIGADRTATFELTGLPAGQYAFAVFHDVNGNGRLDTNLLGVPSEPYAFSNTRVKWKKPTFEEARFFFDGNQARLTVAVKRWSAQ